MLCAEKLSALLRGVRAPPSYSTPGPGCTQGAVSGPTRRLPLAASPATATGIRLLQCLRLCVSVCLCTCACVCLCAQSGEVTVQERCQQPRNGLGMESVSQVEPQGQPALSRSSLSTVTISICAAVVGGAGPAVPGRSRCWAGCVSQGVWAGVPGGAVRVSSSWLLGGEGRGESSWREGRVQPLSGCFVWFGGGTMSPFTRTSPPRGRLRSSPLSLLSCRVVEASTLQQERLQAIAVSPA